MAEALDLLREPLELPCGAVLPNRIAKAAMTEGLSDDGRPNQEHQRLYRSWSDCGAGLLLTGNVQIDSRHLERAGNVVLEAEPDPAARGLFLAWSEAAKSGGAQVWMQISHAGRQTPANVNPRPLGPSDVAVEAGSRCGRPSPMTEADIQGAIEGFARAAAAAKDLGFDGVQIHAAHGYLISSFLNPLANRREDRWGGSLTNRSRLLFEVFEATRAAVGSSFPVSVKLNSADFQAGGFAFEEAAALAERLSEAGADLLEISGGNYEQASMMGLPGGDKRLSTRLREAYFLDFAKSMLEGWTPPLMVTGGFRTAAAMVEAIEAGVAVVGLGRPLCAELDGPRALLDGGRGELARFEETLLNAPAPIDPPTSKPGELTPQFSVIAWFYQQLRRIGQGAPVDLSLTAAEAFVQERRDDAAKACGRRSLGV